ncbi:hypothetical protein TIFTF001_009753 [Ficus carica]|uniref:Uncharacterized protein n=1 Tax=Ficus carica TaxID=3494 RepID=A0AA87ZNQ0_FICCA|nr:hypothetical protein TIFTF001_009753 [Ficus carica]
MPILFTMQYNGQELNNTRDKHLFNASVLGFEGIFVSESDNNVSLTLFVLSVLVFSFDGVHIKEWAVQGTGEGVGKLPVARPHVGGGKFPAPDVQSLWSFD